MKLYYDFVEFIHNPSPGLFLKLYLQTLALYILFRMILGLIVYLIEILKK